MKNVVLAGLLLVAACFVAPANAQYDPNQAFSALYYSKIAYCDASVISDWSCVPCQQYQPSITSQSVFSGDYETQAYTAYNTQTNQIVVAFRGSSNIPNWVADLTFAKVAYPGCSGCEVHEGFYNAWQGLSSSIINSVQSLATANPTANFFVTGHSLGAAIALHCAVTIAQTFPRPVTLYNFGEPRVGNQPFAQFASSVLATGQQYRVTHASDPVPHVPPMAFGFLHTPHELWYNNNGGTNYQDCNDSASAEDPNCSDSTIPIAISDHLLYLGICTECTCSSDPAPVAPLLMPKDYIRAPEEVRLV